MTVLAPALDDLVVASRSDATVSRPHIEPGPVRTQPGKLTVGLRSGLAMLNFVSGTSASSSRVAEPVPVINGGRTVRGEMFTELPAVNPAGRTKDVAILVAADQSRADREEVCWVKEHAGLTWDQLGKVFGVSRRAVHLWSNGARLNEPNARRLRQFAALVRRLEADLGTAARPEMVRSRLLEIDSEGLSLVDRLRRERSSGAAWDAAVRPERLVGAIREPLPDSTVVR